MKCLIIGDTIIDIDVNLKAIGLSLESPTLKTEYKNETIKYGGAANVARHLSLLGADVSFYTSLSTKSAEDLRKQSGIKRIINTKQKSENSKTRYYVQHGNSTYKYLQLNRTNDSQLESEHPIDFKKYDLIAFSDYRCGLIDKEIVQKAEKSKKKTFAASQISSKKSNFDIYQNMNFIVCNKNESNYISNISNVIITDGNNGCYFNNKYYPTEPFKSENIIGAGDCFYAAFIFHQDCDKANSYALKCIKTKI